MRFFHFNIALESLPNLPLPPHGIWRSGKICNKLHRLVILRSNRGQILVFWLPQKSGKSRGRGSDPMFDSNFFVYHNHNASFFGSSHILTVRHLPPHSQAFPLNNRNRHCRPSSNHIHHFYTRIHHHIRRKHRPQRFHHGR